MGLMRKRGAFAALAFMLPATASAQDSTQFLPPIDVWASRTGTGIVGASNSVITAQDIARSPGTTIQDVLSREAGVQTWSTTGANNGATTVVDLRGFGSTASSNTLFLLNGLSHSLVPGERVIQTEMARALSQLLLRTAAAA